MLLEKLGFSDARTELDVEPVGDEGCLGESGGIFAPLNGNSSAHRRPASERVGPRAVLFHFILPLA
jgi:hypothetical protein